jgi:WD40 repeat protein
MFLAYFRKTVVQLVEPSCPFLFFWPESSFPCCESEHDGDGGSQVFLSFYKRTRHLDFSLSWENVLRSLWLWSFGRDTFATASIKKTESVSRIAEPDLAETPGRGVEQGDIFVSQKPCTRIQNNKGGDSDAMVQQDQPIQPLSSKSDFGPRFMEGKGDLILSSQVERSHPSDDSNQEDIPIILKDFPLDSDVHKISTSLKDDHSPIESQCSENRMYLEGQMNQLYETRAMDALSEADISTTTGSTTPSMPSLLNIQLSENVDTSLTDASTTGVVPDIPPNLVGLVIAPFLEDRCTFNSVMLCCKETYEICKTLPAPWPCSRLKAGVKVWAVAFTPDGSLLACGGDNGVVRIWNKCTGKMSSLSGHFGRVYSIVFSPSGKLMASGSGDGGMLLWNVDDDFSCTPMKSQTPHVDCLVFNMDGAMLASGGDGMVRLWCSETRRQLATIPQDNRVVESIAFSPDGSKVAVGSWGHTIRIWNMATLECVVTLTETTCIHSIAYSPDGKYIASASDSAVVRLWNLQYNSFSVLKGHTDSVWSVSFSKDGKKLASGSDDGTVRVWALDAYSSATCERVLSSHQIPYSSVRCVAFASDLKTMASGGDDGNIQLTNYNTQNDWKP